MGPLPWQRRATPLAFLRTVLRWTYTPRKAAREFARPLRAGRAVVFGALCLTIFLLCMGSLSEVSRSWLESQPGVRHAPGDVVLASDIGEWGQKQTFTLGFLSTSVFLLDLLVFALRRRMGVPQILAGWGYGLAPLATWVVPTLLCWAALRDWLGIAAYFTVPVWYALSWPLWTVSRLYAFQWFAGRLRWSEILWLTAGPILVTVGVLNL